MLFFPNCKINIGLNITGKRTDGYHDLETVFYPIYKLYDAIEILPLADQQDTRQELASAVFFQASGLSVAGREQDNLCMKAYYLLKKDFPELPPVHLRLHKNIPMGAGLGGGSADGAFTLMLLNQQFNLKLLTSDLLHYALQLGSDCPFFIINKPCFASGRGEALDLIPLHLSSYSIVLIFPGMPVSTAAAFAGITPKPSVENLQELLSAPVETWHKKVTNDFEQTVFEQQPLLKKIKNKLYATGAAYASMSGSGSTVYGIYRTENLPAAKLYPAFFERHIHL